MKKLLMSVLGLAACFSVRAQDFNKYLTSAKTSYSAGKLEDSRFAMQQMLQELDMISGKEVLKMLPANLGSLNANTANDNVSGASGFAGVVIHRDYGSGDKTSSIEIISNSPLIASVNAILSIPFIGAGSHGNQKIIKIQGYKALVQKDEEISKPSYTVQIPLNSTLVTLKAEGISNDEVINLANSLPVSDIAKTLQ